MNDPHQLAGRIFLNANREPVPYDGSPITWRVSAYVLIVRAGKLLVIRNRLEKFYDVIGGGIEFGEAIEQALHREALEEAGAQISIGPLLHAHTDWFYHRKGTFHQSLLLFYQGELIGELTPPTDPDIASVQFMSRAELATHGGIFPDVIGVLDKLPELQ